MHGSIDLVVDKIETSNWKNKTKIEKKNRVKSGKIVYRWIEEVANYRKETLKNNIPEPMDLDEAWS